MMLRKQNAKAQLVKKKTQDGKVYKVWFQLTLQSVKGRYLWTLLLLLLLLLLCFIYETVFLEIFKFKAYIF